MTTTFRVEITASGYIIHFRDSDNYYWRYVSETTEFFYRLSPHHDWQTACYVPGCSCASSFPIQDIIRDVVAMGNISLMASMFDDRMVELEARMRADEESILLDNELIRQEGIRAENQRLASIYIY
jgi:hypothetical protein